MDLLHNEILQHILKLQTLPLNPGVYILPNTNELTFVILIAHDLSSAVVEADCQAWAFGLDVSLGPWVPVDARNADGSSHIHKAADGHLHLWL